MADLVVVPNAIRLMSGRSTTETAGATGTAGQPVYRDSADDYKVKPADNNVQAKIEVYGVLLSDCLDEESVQVAITDARIDLGATLTVGETYVLSDEVGGIKPIADIATGEYVTIIGVAESADVLEINIFSSGTQHA